MQKHDIHNYMISAQHRIEEAYARMRKHSSEDLGIAGDLGEGDWRNFLRK